MLSLEECLGFCDLEAELVEAPAQHEHLPVMVAVSLANNLLQTPRGIYRLHSALLDEIKAAWNSGDRIKAKSLDRAYAGFRKQRPIPRVLS